MPPSPDSRRAVRVGKSQKKKVLRRWIVWGSVGILLIVLGVAAWVGLRALEAKSALESAQAEIGSLRAQATTFDLDGASETLESVSKHTNHAVELTSDPVWKAVEFLPWAGPNLIAFRELAAVTNDVVDEVVTPLIGVAAGVDPESLAPKDGAINLEPLVEAVPAIASAMSGVERASAEVKTIDTSQTISQIAAARTQIAGLLSEMDPLLATLNSVVPLLAPALGSEAPRTYVVMFQNPAESRALGGTALSFAVVKVDKGRIELGATVPAAYGNFSRYGDSVIPAPDGVEELYPRAFGTFIANVTVRPSFTSAAELTQEMWFRQFGYKPDGVISIDPVALSYIMGASEPITLSTGDVLSRDTLVPLLLNQVYLRYNSKDPDKDNIAQDLVYSEVVNATFSRLTSGPLDPALLISALLQGWDEQRLLYWSANEAEQVQLAALGLNGELPVSDELTERVGVYFQDNVGAKMNFYLQQAVHLAQASCRPDGLTNFRVSVDLTNSVDPASVGTLSPSILGQYKLEKVKRGDQRMIVMLYAPPGSQIAQARINGEPVAMNENHDTDYPVGQLVATVPAGGVTNITFDYVSTKPGPRVMEASVTPMVNPTVTDVVPLDCASIPVG